MIKRIFHSTVIVTLALLVLTGCGVETAPLVATAVSGASQLTTAQLKSSLTTLNGYIKETIKDLQAGDVTKARTQFKLFKDGWYLIKEPVRTVSPDVHRQVEETMVTVDNALANPTAADREKAITTLQALSTTLDTFIATLG